MPTSDSLDPSSSPVELEESNEKILGPLKDCHFCFKISFSGDELATHAPSLKCITIATITVN